MDVGHIDPPPYFLNFPDIWVVWQNNHHTKSSNFETNFVVTLLLLYLKKASIHTTLYNHHTLNLIPHQSLKKLYSRKVICQETLRQYRTSAVGKCALQKIQKRHWRSGWKSPIPAGGSNRPNISNSTKEWIAHYPTILTISPPSSPLPYPSFMSS